ncbi:MAG: exosortase F system-associated protein [Flavobacteriales bacterium]|nr:MAG: exosortase F system-associated protein [Flavobacteriales bacterium]
MNKWLRLGVIGVLVFLLIMVRSLGDRMFYDPFIDYFRNDYLYVDIPGFKFLKLFYHLMLRYLANTLISLAIIYFAFQKKSLVIFSMKFYAIAFVILSIIYYFLLRNGMENGYLFTFYVRRFLIHPVFILVLLPAFYYQEKLVKTKKFSG